MESQLRMSPYAQFKGRATVPHYVKQLGKV